MPEEQNQNEVTYFAETDFRNQRRKFGIKVDDRRRHMYVIGKTGMGKSTLLENMIVEDIRAGHGVGVVDPHGDLAEKILDFIPSNRINDVVYINPSDFDYPIAFNILESIDNNHKHLVASGLMGVFKKIWPDVWSARMEYIMNNAILALLDYPGSTMLGINRVLADKDYRQKVVQRIVDPVVKSFWINEYEQWREQFRNEAIAPILNKVGQFLSASVIRNIVGQVKSTINIRELMDSRKILIMNLAKGRIGEDNSRLLGGMLITKLQLSAMERVEIPENERQDFYLYVDEFQNFATESFANILSEARKYRLDLIVAHQYIEQLDEKVSAAIFGNVGTLICFRVGAADAEVLVKEFTPQFTEEDLVNLAKWHLYLKLMINCVASDPFSAVGLPPLKNEEVTGNRDKVIKVTRERYAVRREIIEEKIGRWSQNVETSQFSADATKKKKIIKKDEVMGGNDSEITVTKVYQSQPTTPTSTAKIEAPKPLVNNIKPKVERPYKANCNRCNRELNLSFQPDGVRPIYCVDCFKAIKEEKEAKKLASEKLAPKNGLPPIGVPVASEAIKPAESVMSLKDLVAKKPVKFSQKRSMVEEPKKEPVNSTTTSDNIPTPVVEKEVKPVENVGSDEKKNVQKMQPGKIYKL